MNTYEQKQENKRERLLNATKKARAKADALYQKGTTALSAIPFGQPILVGHHSERADRSYRSKAVSQIDRSFETSKYADSLESRANNIGSGGISSDDPDAVEKLEIRLKELTTSHELMLAANVAARKAGTERPYPGYSLTNNNANIRRIQQRIKQLTAKKSMVANEPIVGNGFTLKEDIEENRICFVFPGKPAEPVRDLLKRYGFKWSPTRGAWVRQLNGNGRFAAQQLLLKIDTVSI